MIRLHVRTRQGIGAIGGGQSVRSRITQRLDRGSPVKVTVYHRRGSQPDDRRPNPSSKQGDSARSAAFARARFFHSS